MRQCCYSCLAIILPLLQAPAQAPRAGQNEPAPPPRAGQNEPAPSARAVADENAVLALRLAAVIRNPTLPARARATAARALGQMGPAGRGAVPELSAILSDLNRGYPFLVDESLVRALGQMGAAAREAVPALAANGGRDCDLDEAINEALTLILRGARGPARVGVLVESLRSADAGDRLRAAKDLAALGVDARDAATALNAALNDDDPDVRRQVFRALLAIQPGAPPTQAMLGVLIRDLADGNAAVRLAAAKALGQFGPPARFALPALQAAVRNDPDEDVRRLAGDAIARIQGGAEGLGPPAPGP